VLWRRVLRARPELAPLELAAQCQGESALFLCVALAAFHYSVAVPTVQRMPPLGRPVAAPVPLPAVDAALLDQLARNEFTFAPCDAAIDKHTALGRLLGRDRRDFVAEGSRLENEDLRFRDPLVYQIWADGQ